MFKFLKNQKNNKSQNSDIEKRISNDYSEIERFQIICKTYEQYKNIQRLLNNYNISFKIHINYGKNDNIKQLIETKPLFIEINIKEKEYITFFTEMFNKIRGIPPYTEIEMCDYESFIKKYGGHFGDYI